MNNPHQTNLARRRLRRTICASWFVTLLLALRTVVQAQFTCATNNGTVTITRYAGPGGWVTIPSTIDGLPVTSIGAGAFGNSLEQPYVPPQTGVTIPGSIISVGDYAFAGCSSLTGVYFGGDPPSLGGPFVFEEDYGNIVYYLYGTTGWGPTFGGCPTALWSWGYICTTNNGTITITGYTGPGGDVAIPNTLNGLPVTSIRGRAFEGCASLANITIPDSVTSLGNQAFCECFGLTDATIRNSVTSIGANAFNYCTSLTGVYFAGNAPALGGVVAVHR